MYARFLKSALGATVIACLSTGCGFHSSPPVASHSGHRKGRVDAHAVSTIVKSPTPKVTVLHPVSFMNLTQGTTASTQKITLPVQNSANDTLALTTNPASGTGSLTITSASGQTLLTLPQVGGLSILQFGSVHPPVLITQAAGNLCGSGGCDYSAYTWSAQRQHFVSIPAPAVASFTYDPVKNQFTEVTTTPVGGFFGFLSANANGVNLDERLYDLWQHEEVLPYAYATNGTPGGQWVSNGAPEYTPTGPLPTTMIDSPTLALEALLEARSLNLKTQGFLLLPGGSIDESVWHNLSGVSSWGPSLWIDNNASSVTAGPKGSQTVKEIISGMHGNHPASVLKAFRLTAQATPTSGTYLISQARLSSVALKINSVLAVLADLRNSAYARHYLTQHPGPVSVTAFGLAWQVSVGSGSQTHQWIQINARTGSLTSNSPPA